MTHAATHAATCSECALGRALLTRAITTLPPAMASMAIGLIETLTPLAGDMLGGILHAVGETVMLVQAETESAGDRLPCLACLLKSRTMPHRADCPASRSAVPPVL